MTTSETANLISLSDASKLGVTALVREAEGGREQLIVRDGRPVAVVMSMVMSRSSQLAAGEFVGRGSGAEEQPLRSG